LGDVATLQPLAETLEFEGTAMTVVERHFDELVDAFRQFQLASAASDTCGEDLARSRCKLAQSALVSAHSRVEFIRETRQSVNANRRALWDNLREGEETLLVASSTSLNNAIVMNARRRCARIVAFDLCFVRRRRKSAGNRL
jgi:hypothetical protein